MVVLVPVDVIVNEFALGSNGTIPTLNGKCGIHLSLRDFNFNYVGGTKGCPIGVLFKSGALWPTTS